MKQLLDRVHSVAVGCPLVARAFPQHSLFAWVRAIGWSVRMVLAFDAGGSQAAVRLLQRVPHPVPCMEGYSLSMQTRKVQLDAASLRSWTRLLLDARACFSEALALCAGLACLGWDCSVQVGYACVEVFASTPLHAWVEYHGTPVSDVLDVRYGYVPLQHYSPGRSL